jgi:hypothetical protein
MYGRLIGHPDGRSARLFDARKEPGFTPSGRTNGIGLPNYQAGWFNLAGGQKALLFITDWSRSVIVPTDEDFVVLVSPDDPNAFLAALRARSAAAGQKRATGPSTFPLAAPRASYDSLPVFLRTVSLIPLFLAVLLGGLTWYSRHLRFELSPEGLRIRGPYGRLIPRDALDARNARIVNMKTDPSFRWMIRTNGIGMPGFGAGWFRFKGGRRALAFVNQFTKVVEIPTNLGYCVLLSPAEPEGFLRELRG